MVRQLFKPEHNEFLFENYKGRYSQELADLINEKFGTHFTATQMSSFRSRHGLDSGITGHIQKGNVPWNKGKTGYMGANKTSFKKGIKPHNWKPIGYERITKDGYIEVKVRDRQKQNNFELKHRIVWGKHYGKIPHNHAVMFKDGDKLNCDIDNLMLVSRGQLAVFNKHYKQSGYPLLDEVTLNKIKLDLEVKEKRNK